MATKDDIKLLKQEVLILERLVNGLNTAVVALCYATKVKGNELDGVHSDEYIKFVEEHVHPLVKTADGIVAEAAKKLKEEADKEEANEK